MTKLPESDASAPHLLENLSEQAAPCCTAFVLVRSCHDRAKACVALRNGSRPSQHLKLQSQPCYLFGAANRAAMPGDARCI